MGLFFVLILIPVVLGFAVQSHVKSQFRKYSKVGSMRGVTAAQVARDILDRHGLRGVPVERVGGRLTDHYDPRKKVLRLSDPVYSSTSLAAIGIAAHEAGHALQDADAYTPLKARNAFAPAAGFASNMLMPLALMGLFFHMTGLLWLGIIGYAAAAVFAVITLPVEFNASRRAMALIRNNGYLTSQEEDGARGVLSAAALTYVAATLIAVMQLLILLGLSRD